MRFFINISFTVCLYYMFNTYAYAVYCTSLYIPNNSTIYNFGNITLDSGVSRAEKTLSFYHLGQGVKVAGNGNNPSSTSSGSGEKRYWMVYPYGPNDYQGISITIKAERYDAIQGKFALTKTNIRTGYYGLIPRSSDCNSPGAMYFFLRDLPIVDGIKLDITRGDVYPGHYDISIPFALGVEENAHSNNESAAPAPDSYFSSLLSRVNSYFLKGSIDVISSCRFIQDEINFNFGDVSLSDALSGVKKKSSLGISCSNPARVKLSVQGGSLRSNMTSCGPGVCTVPIGENGDSFTTTTVSTSKQLELEASFKTNKAFSGEFNGSLVLSMEII